jgi:DNA-binding MarR family transcriptional regulator
MNTDRPTPSGSDQFRSLQILDELSNNDSLTQRDLSVRLGIALGLVNSYIKNLVAKGYITVKAIPAKRYAYYLTPKGFTEKTRLTYDLLHDYTRVYREARKNLTQLFHDLQTNGMKRIVFAGVDEVAEISYITLQETTLELVAVMDAEKTGSNFFGMTIRPFPDIAGMTYDCVVVTAYVKKDLVYQELINNGVNKKDIRSIFPFTDRKRTPAAILMRST